MVTVYLLTKYTYSSYSYSGVEPSDIRVFASLSGAEKYAEEQGLIVTEYPEKDNHCTIEGEQVYA